MIIREAKLEDAEAIAKVHVDKYLSKINCIFLAKFEIMERSQVRSPSAQRSCPLSATP